MSKELKTQVIVICHVPEIKPAPGAAYYRQPEHKCEYHCALSWDNHSCQHPKALKRRVQMARYSGMIVNNPKRCPLSEVYSNE